MVSHRDIKVQVQHYFLLISKRSLVHLADEMRADIQLPDIKVQVQHYFLLISKRRLVHLADEMCADIQLPEN
jgi:hypothetical protein